MTSDDIQAVTDAIAGAALLVVAAALGLLAVWLLS